MSEQATQEEQTDQPREKKKSLIWRLFKWTFFILIFLYIVFTILANIGGNSAVLKEAAEDFLEQRTGMQASVGTLNRMSFFPDIGIDMEGVVLTPEDGAEEKVVTIEKAKIAMRFFDVMFGRSAIRGIDVQKVSLPAGTLFEASTTFDYIKTIESEGKASLEVKGEINSKPVYLSAALTPQGTPYSRFYKVEDTIPIKAGLDKVTFSADIEKVQTGGSNFKNLLVLNNKNKALEGNIFLIKRDMLWSVSGEVNLNSGLTNLKPDLKIHSGEKTIIEGRLESDQLRISDLGENSSFRKAIDNIEEIFTAKKKAGYDFTNKDIDVDLEIKNLKQGKVNLGTAKAKLITKENTLNLSDISGEIINGALDGSASLDASQNPATLKAAIQIKGLNYGNLQRQFQEKAEIDGKANLAIKLNSAGNTGTQLKSNLRGDVSFIGGTGRLRSGVLNVWGGGLLNALLPDISEQDDLTVNCVVADFDVLKGNAEAKSLFVDTQRLTVTGEGVYSIRNDKADFKFTPRPKDVAIGDISSSIVLKGPLSDLSVEPSAFGLGKKIGGLLLGAINPAFLAVTLADLGLSEDHPCKAFVIEKENLPPPQE